MKRLAVAGISLALALPVVAVAQSGIRYQSPAMAAPTSLAPALPAAKPYTFNGKVVADIVVRVNDAVITRADVMKAQQQMLNDVQNHRLDPAQLPEMQRNLLRDLIDQQLLLSRGKQLDINPQAEVVRQLDAVRKQNNIASMEELQQRVEAEGTSYEDLKAQYANNIITQQVIRDEVARRMQPPSQEKIQAYYNAHKADFQLPEQITLSEILVPTPPDATDAQVSQAKARAETIVSEVKAGANFDDEAKKNSGGQTAATGGELGTFKVGKGELAKVFEDQTVGLPVGGVSAPIRTKQGYVVLKVTAHTPAGAAQLKDVETEIQNAIFQEEMTPALRNYLTHLRENSYIDIAPGFIDSGRSPNQSNAIFAAATPPPAPKVKKPKTADSRFARNPAATTKGSIPALPSASTNGTAIASNGKPVKQKKIKREKVRFGQAPRTALAAGTTEVAEEPTGNAAPGPASTPQAEAPQVAAAEPEANPMEPVAPVLKKTRFSKTEPVNGPKAPKKITAKDRERALAQAIPLTAEEKQQQAMQSEALGLNGDTSKKPKKAKKVKGQPEAPKERIQERQVVAPQQPAATVNKNLGAPIEGQSSTSQPSGGQTPAPATK